MSFTPVIIPQTINSSSHLQITDTSVYGAGLGSLSKTSFTGRTVILTRYDGVTQTVAFPYVSMNDTVQDQVVITNYFNGVNGSQLNIDMIVSITVNFIYLVAGVPTSVAYFTIYQSKSNTMNSLANLAIATYLGGGPTELYTDSLVQQKANSLIMRDIINNVEASKAKITVGDLVTAQKLLQYAYDLCPPTANYEC